MHTTPTHFVISVPRLAGYKTLVVNAAVLVFGVLAVFYPKFHTPAPDAVGLLYDQMAGAAVAVVAVLNMALRLITTTPALAAGTRELHARAADALAMEATREAIVGAASSLGYWPGYPSWPVVDGIQHTDDCAMRITGRCNCEAAVPSRTAELNAQLAAYKDAQRTLSDTVQARARIPVIMPEDVTVAEAVQMASADGMAELEAVRAEMRNAAYAGDWVRVTRTGEKAATIASGSEPVQDPMPEARHDDGMIGSLMGPRTGPQLVRAFLLPFLLVPMLFLGVVSLAGCGTVQEAGHVIAAADVEQRAFALYGSFVALEETAADLVVDKRVPLKARRAIQAADKVAKPVADQVRNLAVDLNVARLKFNTAQGGADKVAALSSSLGLLLLKFGSQVAALTSAIAVAK